MEIFLKVFCKLWKSRQIIPNILSTYEAEIHGRQWDETVYNGDRVTCLQN